MSVLVAALVTLVFLLLAKLFNLHSSPQMPQLYAGDQKFLESIRKYCPTLSQIYRPTPLWGRSGHVQTVLHAVVGRVRVDRCRRGRRRHAWLSDGGLLTWDEWPPLQEHPSVTGDVTLAVCPGIGNSSETVYISSFVNYACQQGFRCIVLNHLGVLQSVRLTSPRIFGYGRTEELDLMLRQHHVLYPESRVMLVGFSMGGNIVTKYMSEQRPLRVSTVVGGISICQGYDALRCLNSMLTSLVCRYYVLIMTERLKSLIFRHAGVLLSDEMKTRHQLDERKILKSATLSDLDEAYSRRVGGYDSLERFYADNSCGDRLQSIDLPMVFINARDDPLVPDQLLPVIRRHCLKHSDALLVETTHGGHLGFFEGGVIVPSSVTWLDRTVVHLSHALLATRGV